MLKRPVTSWSATVLAMAPLAVLGLCSTFVQDVMTEMPSDMPSVKNALAHDEIRCRCVIATDSRA